MDERKLKNAQNVYKTLCDELDGKNVHYQKHPEDLVVTFTMQGDDLPMQIIVNVDAERELVRLASPIPATIGADKRLEGAIATSQVNYYLADGSFDYDYTTGRIFFRITSSYVDSLISKKVFEYLITATLFIVEEYNDKFLMLAKGLLPLDAFLKTP